MKVKRNNKNKKWLLGFTIGIILGLIIGTIAGYYISWQNMAKRQPVPTTSSSESQLQSNQDNSSQLPQTSNSHQESTTVQQTYRAYGRFEGEIDTHSIEVLLLNTGFDYKTFEIDTAALQKYNLKPGTILELEFELPQSSGNPKIVKINVPEEITLKGKYVGLADNNFAEFLFDQKHVVLQITAVSSLVSYLEENTDVEVTFKTNPQDPASNPIVTDIKVLE